jgi:CBS domain-containing membrane protein
MLIGLDTQQQSIRSRIHVVSGASRGRRRIACVRAQEVRALTSRPGSRQGERLSANWIGLCKRLGNASCRARRRTTMAQLHVRDLMTKKVVSLNHNDSLAVADATMRSGRFRHVVVVDEDDALVGILSQRDLFHGGLLKALGYGTRAKTQALEMLVVKEAMVNDVVTTTPDTPLSQAASVMLERKIGCLPVLESGRIVGIITESDFVAHVARRAS